MAPLASPSNPFKRQIDAVQHVYDCAKRLKTDDSAQPAGSSEHTPAPTHVLENAAERSEGDGDNESWVSESSEEPSDESSVESSEADDEDEDEDEDDMNGEETQLDTDQVVNLRANRGERPDFKLPDGEEIEDIRPFLKEFLPQLKAANEELEAQKAAGTLQTSELNVDEEEPSGEQYIEMNLGLGVLEAKGDDEDDGARDTSDDDSVGGDEAQKDQEQDIFGKLIGREKPTQPVGIEEVADTQGTT